MSQTKGINVQFINPFDYLYHPSKDQLTFKKSYIQSNFHIFSTTHSNYFINLVTILLSYLDTIFEKFNFLI